MRMEDSLLESDEPEPAEIIDGCEAEFLLECEHAGCAIPRLLDGLGLADNELKSHIGWDIGAAQVTRGLSKRLGAPAILQRYSRLVIDCNRSPEAPDSMPEVSHGVRIPGNMNLGRQDRMTRRQCIFDPFDRAVGQMVGRPGLKLVVAVHSFTPLAFGVKRPWDIGFLFRQGSQNRRAGLPLVVADAALAGHRTQSALSAGRRLRLVHSETCRTERRAASDDRNLQPAYCNRGRRRRVVRPVGRNDHRRSGCGRVQLNEERLATLSDVTGPKPTATARAATQHRTGRQRSPAGAAMREDAARRGPVIMLFRRDLRLDDNPAFNWAVASGRPVVPLFAFCRETDGSHIGTASRWWLGRSLRSLAGDLAAIGGRLVLRSGSASDVVPELARETGASAVVWNRLYVPSAIDRDSRLKSGLRAGGLDARSFNASLLFEPWTVTTDSGSPYRVFTPFWRRCLAIGLPMPETVPHSPSFTVRPSGESVDSLIGEPDNRRVCGLAETWTPGSIPARDRLENFIENDLVHYRSGRDLMGVNRTSRLSPHLHFGEISPRQVVAAALHRDGSDSFIRQLGWREFSAHLMFNFPAMATRNLRREFDAMPWRDDPDGLERWRKGLTGYPLVDAGMRQLLRTGWMHNRARMVAASFLAKHLMIDWRHGAEWFHQSLVDADLANNNAGWQWTAGCGADAAPYFRIFNPVLQSRRFDPDGRFLRRWLPELAALPTADIHAPWAASEDVLSAAGISLDSDYPRPMVDHAIARARRSTFMQLTSRRLDRPRQACVPTAIRRRFAQGRIHRHACAFL